LTIATYVASVVLLSYQNNYTLYAKIAGTLLVLFFAFRCISNSQKIIFPLEYKILLIWLFLGVLSTSFSDESAIGFMRLLTLLQIYPIALLLTNLIYWNRSAMFYWWALVGTAAISGLVGLSNPIRYSGIDGRLFGTLEHPSAFSTMMAVGFCICVAAFPTLRSVFTKAISVALALLFLYLIALSGSRICAIAAMGGAITLAFCFLYTHGTNLGKSVIVISLSVLLAIGAGILLSSVYTGRFENLLTLVETGNVNLANESSLAGRVWMYKAGWKIALDNPLLGAGLDAFRGMGTAPGLTVRNNLHSNYVDILANTGFPGALLYFSMYIIWMKRLIGTRELLRDINYATPITIAISLTALLFIIDLGWVTYYGKVPWLVIPGLIAEANIVKDLQRCPPPERCDSTVSSSVKSTG
jgi:O-antigen ligase